MSTTANTSTASSPDANIDIKGQNEVSSNTANASLSSNVQSSNCNPANEMESNFVIAKLRCLKEVREKTMQLERLRKQLKSEVGETEYEEKCLTEYKKEMESLLSEKMAHVEELRQIHADIHSMEVVIKQSEEERNRHLEMAKHLHQEYQPLKEVIDKLRSDIGLHPLPELHEEDEKISPEFFEKTPKVTETAAWHTIVHQQPSSTDPQITSSESRGRGTTGASEKSSSDHSHSHHEPDSQLSVMSQQASSSLIAAANASAAAASAAQMHHHFSNMHAAVQRVGHSGKAPGSSNTFGLHGIGGNSASSLMDRPSGLVASSAMRQQPPPMKSCQSCHQQIHRNAPICPLCKAKSRSRNPKKPKRRVED